VHAQFKKRERKLNDRIMMDNLLTWLFWSGAAVIVYSAISASIRYVHHWRRGSRTMAAQAAVQALLCTFGLVTAWAIYRVYMPG
jgi:hypothetical protein